MTEVRPDNRIVLMDNERVKRALRRMCFEIIEQNREFSDLLIIGLNKRGHKLAEMINQNLLQLECETGGLHNIDIHFDPDDQINKLPDTDNANIIIVDDVLFSGKTMLKALEYVLKAGEPSKIQVAVLVDRGHRNFPVEATFTGLHHPTKLREHVQVEIGKNDESVEVLMFPRY